jgi:hypothetical protein
VCGVVVYPILGLLCVWCGSVSYTRAAVVCGVVVCLILELLCVWCGSVSYPGAVVCVVW